MSATITRETVWEDAGATNMARVLGNAGTAITQATLSSIGYKVWDKADPTSTVVSTTLTISSVVYDTLQTDARWSVDSTGYNFLHQVAASVLSGANKTYRVEYKFTPTSGEVFFAVFELTTAAIYGS